MYTGRGLCHGGNYQQNGNSGTKYFDIFAAHISIYLYHNILPNIAERIYLFTFRINYVKNFQIERLPMLKQNSRLCYQDKYK